MNRKKWRGWEKDKAGCHNSANHSSGVTAAAPIFDGTRGRLFTADQLDGVDIDVELSAARPFSA
jgi:hypothetical protein